MFLIWGTWFLWWYLRCGAAQSYPTPCTVLERLQLLWDFLHEVDATWNRWWLGPISSYLSIFQPHFMVIRCDQCFPLALFWSMLLDISWNAWTLFFGWHSFQLHENYQPSGTTRSRIPTLLELSLYAVATIAVPPTPRGPATRVELLSSGCVFQREILLKPGRCTALEKGCTGLDPAVLWKRNEGQHL